MGNRRLRNLLIKRLLILSILMIFGLISLAQQISVKSFQQLKNDLDARVHYAREDKNGEKAAIIKIVTTETGFDFDGGTIGIVVTVQKTGEIWLYIPRGSKTLTIKHPKLGILRNYVYPQAITSGSVYEMLLTTARVVTTIEEPAIESQWLIISSEPSGADVYIDNQPAGKTPYANELPTGKYSWKISKELYFPEAGIVELIPGGEKQKLKLNLKPNFGTLNISSRPEGSANVTLDGIATGKVTPCIIDMVPSGNHSITLSLDMYETTTQKIDLAAGETKQLVVTMSPTFTEVNVTTIPDAEIYINEKLQSRTKWKGRLNPGVYTFEAKLDKFNTATSRLTVVVGQPLNVQLTPTAKTGNLKVMSTPFEAAIKVDGKEVGQTPATLKNLLIGNYTVELSLADYATSIKTVSITEGKTAELNFTLQSLTDDNPLKTEKPRFSKERPDKSFFLMYVGNSNTYLGLRAGMLGAVGFYGEIRCNLLAFEKSKFTYKDGNVDYDQPGYYSFTGSNGYASYSGLAGINFQPVKNGFLYLGIGYGKQDYLMKIDEFSYNGDTYVSSSYVKYDQYCTSGLEIDLGIMYRIKSMVLSAGGTMLNFNTFGWTAGIGLDF